MTNATNEYIEVRRSQITYSAKAGYVRHDFAKRLFKAFEKKRDKPQARVMAFLEAETRDYRC